MKHFALDNSIEINWHNIKYGSYNENYQSLFDDIFSKLPQYLNQNVSLNKFYKLLKTKNISNRFLKTLLNDILYKNTSLYFSNYKRFILLHNEMFKNEIYNGLIREHYMTILQNDIPIWYLSIKEIGWEIFNGIYLISNFHKEENHYFWIVNAIYGIIKLLQLNLFYNHNFEMVSLFLIHLCNKLNCLSLAYHLIPKIKKLYYSNFDFFRSSDKNILFNSLYLNNKSQESISINLQILSFINELLMV